MDCLLLYLLGLMAKSNHGNDKNDERRCRFCTTTRKEWDEIFDGIHDVVDACAFQDGHIDYDELDAFFSVNKN